MSDTPLLIFGATGQIGSQVLRQLIAANATAIAAVRDPAKAEKALPAGVRTVKADLTDPVSASAAVKESKATTAFIYAQNGGMNDTVHALASSGIRHVVLLSSFFVDHAYAADDDAIVALHKPVEQNIKSARLTYTFLRCGVFSSSVFHWWKESIGHGGVVKTSYPNAAFAPITDEDIAAVAVRALTTSDLNNQQVDIVGPNLHTQRELLQIISEVINKPIQVVEITEQEHLTMLSAHIPTQYAKSIINYLKYSSTHVEPIIASNNIQKYGNRLPITFKKYVEKNQKKLGL